MRDHESQIKAKGAHLAAVGLGGMEYARQFRVETKIDFPLLVDEDGTGHRAASLGKANILHLFRRDNVAYRKRAKGEGHRQRKLGKEAFQLGGSFVFAPGNLDLYAHISGTFGDNAPVSDLVDALPDKSPE